MKRILALQLLACLAISSATAIPITQTLPFAGGTGNFTDPLLFNRFDTSLGTLTGVTISMTGEGFGIVTVMNAGSWLGFTSGHAEVPVQVVGPNGVTISTTIIASGIGGTAPPGGPTSFPGSYSSAYAASGPVPSVDWGSYSGVGPGTFSVNALVAGGTSGGTQIGGFSSQLFFGASETVNGTVTVTYDYTAVPDGGITAMLLGMGMLGLGMVRRMVK